MVVRTRNEVVWIARCLRALSCQRNREFEVIVVDNESTDGTQEVVRSYGCRLVNISAPEFTYGRAINMGIEASVGHEIAIVSGHCVPATERWLERLSLNLVDDRVAGVYGRQEPLPDSSPFDKRDLWTTFGLDRRVQTRDWFFHNANALVRRSVWAEIPFNETIAGVEDREWARRVLARGYHLVYEPRASVFHFHGIHQGNDEARAARVARVIELIGNTKI